MKPLRVGILGGGPAGLYTAILLKNQNPAHEITLIERNPAGATFGFGVVLSDRTLTGFQQADAKSYAALMAHQITWGTMEIIHKGVKTPVHGHHYLGIARKKLLEILSARTTELGVRMEFQREVDGLSAFGDCDLYVAADGVNSITRKTYNDSFQATALQSKSKFIWLAVEMESPGFRFIFHETEHGLFQAHMYPFEQGKTTCIVQCRNETWERLGLDQLDEPSSVQFCKELLKPYLGNANFLSNRSLWSTFQLVRAKNWSYKNIVLMGDAVHTGHFNIGSGTKLAMEDAITLVKALERYDDIPTALRNYQLERKPVAERLQAAGRAGELYCENIDQRTHLDPLPFTFQFMIRTPRMDYAELKRRDPSFVENMDKRFTERAAAEAGVPAGGTVTPAETPVKIQNLLLKNRVVSAQPATNTAADGLPDSSYFDRLRKQTGGSAGMVLTDVVAASDRGRNNRGSAGMYQEGHLEAWKEVLFDIHAQTDTKVALQLGFAHAQGADLDQVREDFVQAAAKAAAAGFDLLHLNMAERSLLGSFLWTLSNHRTDAFGGSLENRLRFPLSVLTAVHSVWPAGKPLGVAFSVADAGSVAEAVALAHALRENGCDLVQVVSGEAGASEVSEYSEQVRNGAGIQTMVIAGRNSTANTVIGGARADICLMPA